jgi:5-amino-6-(5-phospho-D-ribitylamino)uracil phosphatase
VPPLYRPQLIGLDLDGTVVDEHNTVPDATRAALHACHQAGIALSFLTGRRTWTAEPLLAQIGLPALVATSSGCLIWRFPEWRMLKRQLFPQELLPRIAELTAPYSVNFYLDTSQTDIEFMQLKRQATPESEHHMQRYGRKVQFIHDAAELAGHPVTQVALPAPAGVAELLCDKVRTALNGQVLALSVRWPLLPATALEVFHSEATKGTALSYIAGQLEVAREACMAVGDDVNDTPMLSWAGWGVAMPQAGEDVKAAANEALSGDSARALAPYLASLLDLPQRPG